MEEAVESNKWYLPKELKAGDDSAHLYDPGSAHKEEIFMKVLEHGPLDLDVMISNTNEEYQSLYRDSKYCNGTVMYLAY